MCTAIALQFFRTGTAALASPAGASPTTVAAKVVVHGARHSPWSKRGNVKVFYAVQTGTKPPTFTLFVSDPSQIEDNYVRFLRRSLSEELDLLHVPLRLRFRRK